MSHRPNKPFFDVKAYGAVGDGTTDDTTSLQATIDACHTAGGGVVWFPASTYKITAALKLYTGTTPTITAYSNITLMGAGSSATNGTIISQFTTGIDVIKGINDVANGAQSTNLTFKNFCMAFGGGTLTNSGNGLYLSQQSTGGPSYQQCNFENVVAQNMQGSGKYGFNFESMITSAVHTCMAVTCANGFYLNGAVGGAYNSVSTSVTFQNCYANMATNGVNGFNDVDNTYISYIGCAVDIGATSTGAAYTANGSSSISYVACGCELDGTHSLSTGWLIEGGGAGIGIYDCYMFQSKGTVDVYVTGTTVGVQVVGFQDNSTISGSTGIKIDAGSEVTEIGNGIAGVATPRTIAAGGIDHILDDISGNMLPAGNITMTDAKNIAVGTTTGTKIGTSTSQKLGFFNATPVIQQSATGDIGTILATLGLRTSGSSYLISTSGTVSVSGNFKLAPTARTASATLTTSSSVIQLCSATSAAFTITLASAATAGAGAMVIAKKTDSSANTVTISRAGSDTIDGATTYSLATQYKYVTLISDGTSVWNVIGNN